jgi:Nif-specific ferredoxin III
MAFTVTLPSGVEWTPKFVQSIDQEKCIGCGRCYKVCSRQVMQLRGVDEDGQFVSVDPDDDDDEYEKKVMTLAQPEHCIGCQACAMVCPKKCYSHAAV